MIQSMTGFGRGEATWTAGSIAVEIKTVNHRYLDVALRLPKEISLFEEEVRSLIRGSLTRGRAEGFVKMEMSGELPRSVSVDLALARSYFSHSEELRTALGLNDQLKVAELLRMPDVIQISEAELDLDELRVALQQATERALEGVKAMRGKEGQQLCADIEQRLTSLTELLAIVEESSPLVVEEYRTRLTARIEELLRDGPALDNNRLAQEVAYFADRACISEEIVRLKSHLKQFTTLLQGSGGIGRKLDFLLQEMNREVNTIGSKTADAAIALKVVDMKSELEKIREQVQNLE